MRERQPCGAICQRRDGVICPNDSCDIETGVYVPLMTSPTPPQLPEVEVLPCDREAAWNFAPKCYLNDESGGTVKAWMNGKYDNAAPAIKAFARHRTEALAKSNEEREALAERVKGLEEVIATYMRFVGETANQCLALALSKDHLAPDAALKGIFDKSQELTSVGFSALYPQSTSDGGEG